MLTHWSYVFLALIHRYDLPQETTTLLVAWRNINTATVDMQSTLWYEYHSHLNMQHARHSFVRLSATLTMPIFRHKLHTNCIELPMQQLILPTHNGGHNKPLIIFLLAYWWLSEDCGISTALVWEIQQSCTKPFISNSTGLGIHPQFSASTGSFNIKMVLHRSWELLSSDKTIFPLKQLKSQPCCQPTTRKPRLSRGRRWEGWELSWDCSDSLAQECSISIANELEIPQPYTQPSILYSCFVD